MGDWIALRKVIGDLVMPPAGPLLLALAGLVLARRWPRAGRALVVSAIAALWVLSMPFVGDQLGHARGAREPIAPERLREAQAIVIPGGGVRPFAREYGGFTMSRLTLERVRYGARLARESGLPIAVVGGKARPDFPSEAEVMRAALADEYRLAVRWAEPTSRNTRQNAERLAPILAADGIKRIVLVTHGVDAPRFLDEFSAVGFEVTVAPTRLAHRDEVGLDSFLPSLKALEDNYLLIYEMLARVVNGRPAQRATP